MDATETLTVWRLECPGWPVVGLAARAAAVGLGPGHGWRWMRAGRHDGNRT